MRWRLIQEEYNPEFIYTQASKNITADSLSRFDIANTNNTIKLNQSYFTEHFLYKKEDVLLPIKFKIVIQCQWNKKSLIETAKSNKDY